MISIIVAVSLNNVIGINGKIPWYLSRDLRRFKKLTTGKVIVMGRKTYESIGKALPDRKNIVLSRSNINIKDAYVVSDPNQIVEEDIFIIGGSYIYKHYINKADKIYLTKVYLNVEGDTFFPNFNINEFYEEKEFSGTSKSGIKYEFINYLKK